MSSAAARPTRHPERVGLPAWQLVALAGCTAVALAVAGLASAQGQLTPQVGAAAGAGVALLAVLGLPSLSISLVSRVLTGVSAAVMVRFGVFGSAVAGSGQLLLLWVLAAIGVLVLTDRISAERSEPARGGALASPDPVAPRAAPLAVARRALPVAALILAVALVLAPVVMTRVGRPAEPGRGATLDPTQQGGSSLRATDALDMTQRPELSDDVVFTVESDRATFWRGETFDLWDGRTWRRSDPGFIPLADVDRLQIGADDLGARGPDVVEQRIRIEANFADVVYAAPSPVRLDIDRPVRQRADGTLQSAPLGQGATYTVESRREPLSADRLRAVEGGEIPEAVQGLYARPPVTTDRVRDLATEITAGADTTFDKIQAIQDWMGDRVTYSLDAPLSPPDQDVVDHFLFDAEQGWCEQIASSLVVLARQNGIPARLATGFVPEERDPVTGTFTVRERNAHAWAEVWFPEVGWVPFDPTAEVPFAGDDAAEPTVGAWILQHALLLLLGAATLALVAGPVRRAVARRWASRSRRSSAGAPAWTALVDDRLDALGARVGQARAPSETSGAYAARLGTIWSAPALVEVGRTVDLARYAPEPAPAALPAALEAALVEVEAAPTPSVPPVEAPLPVG